MSLRILHFSDVHLPFPAGAFRTPEIFHPKRLVALLNFYLRRGSKYADAVQKLNGLNDFLRREPVDYVLFTRRHAEFRLEREFAEAAPRLAETLGLARRGALAVPGNHVLYTRSSSSSTASCSRAGPVRPAGSRRPTGYPLVRGWARTPRPSRSIRRGQLQTSGTPAAGCPRWNSDA
jgi:hypothetical protein